MKKIYILLIVLCLLAVGCGKLSGAEKHREEAVLEEGAASTLEEEKSDPLIKEILSEKQESLETEKETEENLTKEERSKLLLEEYLKNPGILETPVREYGEEIGFIQLEEDLVARILYPEGEIDALNSEIVNWVTVIAEEYMEESKGSSEYGEAAEFTAEYDSYVVEEDIVSVKITGIYDKPYLAHPIDIIKTFHASLNSGKLLSLEELLSNMGKERLKEMVVEETGIEAELADEHLLDHWTLTEDGLEIILERGSYLPMSDGTVTLQFTYEELDGILLTKGEEEKEVIAEEKTEPIIIEKATEEFPVNSQQPMVALTFDDGPSKHTARLLDMFASYGGKGTFFVVGNVLENREETLQRMVGEGHEIAGHSWNHRQLTKLSSEELKDQIMTTRAKIYEITGVDPTLLRPPYGSYNNETKEVCAELGVVMANWSLDTLDWKYKDADRIYSTIMKEVKDGDIILCHDLHGTTVDAMERVIPALLEKGYQLVTVTELLSHSGKEITAGGVYNKR